MVVTPAAVAAVLLLLVVTATAGRAAVLRFIAAILEAVVNLLRWGAAVLSRWAP